MYDSIYVDRSRDTLLIERWHTRYRDVIKYDSIYIEHVDSVAVPYEVEKVVEVEKSLKWWQSAAMWIGALAIVLFGLWLYRRVKG
jgi:hypothetical protein